MSSNLENTVALSVEEAEELVRKKQTENAIADTQLVNTPESAEEAIEKSLTSASDVFGLYHSRFQKMVDVLSKKEAQNVLKAIVLFPLEGNPQWIDSTMNRQILKDTYYTGMTLLEAKQIMQQIVLTKELQERAAKEAEANAAGTTSTSEGTKE